MARHNFQESALAFEDDDEDVFIINHIHSSIIGSKVCLDR